MVIFGWFYSKMLICKNVSRRRNVVILVGCCDSAKFKKKHENSTEKSEEKKRCSAIFQKIAGSKNPKSL